MSTQVKGTALSHEQQREVLARFVHRHTGNHKPMWAANRPEYPIQFKDDADWLANTTFTVRADGRLDQRTKFCHSTPTWPNGMSLLAKAFS